MPSYEISVRGHLDAGLVDALGAGDATTLPATTVLRPLGAEELHAVLARLQALGLEVHEVRQVEEAGAR